VQLIDLSREIHHRTQVHPSHPPVVMTVWNDHDEIKRAGDFEFSSKAMSIAFSDHAGTHVDAPVHFDARPGAESIDEMPLERFFTEAICLDLSHVPLKHAVTVPEIEAALAASGQEIRKGDTVLVWLATNERLLGKPGYLHDFPGLSIEAISPAPEGELNFRAHRACAERGITHMECLANLDKLVGKGRFRFIGFPLRIRGGTASPIRAVALFE